MSEARTHLDEAIATFGADSPLTALVPQLDEIDPDDAFSAVPYEKGLALLNHLTDVVGGRPQFEAFARDYVSNWQMRTLTSAEFCNCFLNYCDKKKIDASGVDWDGWFYTPGQPIVDLAFPDTLGKGCTDLIDKWMDAGGTNDDAADAASRFNGFAASDYTPLPSKLKIHFLDQLYSRCASAALPPLSAIALERMDDLYGLTPSKNSEVRLRWQRTCLLHRRAAIVPHVLAFVKEQGRMKFVRPLYRDLYAWETHRISAVETFKAWRENYHPICAKMLAQDLKV